VEFFARVIPALQVSGDFYDYFTDAESQLTFAIADVCGKGMPAALFMTMCLTHLRNLGPGIPGAADTLRKLNDAITRSNTGGMFVTMALGKWNPLLKAVSLSYAGHPLGLFRHQSGEVQLVGAHTGPLLGWGDLPTPIVDMTVQLHPGDALFFYTDGVTEAVDGKNGTRMFGIESLKDVVRKLPSGEPIPDWASRIQNAVNAYGEGEPLGDDLTLLILRRTE
jgi:sigma-B regulation protein RsbU (phosphoserine phosphatase)